MPSASGTASVRPLAAWPEPLPCRKGPADLWFSEQPDDLERAKASCQPCPLRAVCLAGAIKRAEPYGVWGGEIFLRGSIIAGKRARGRPRSDRGRRPCIR